MSELLPILDDEIAARAEAVIDARPDWPCRKGCDDCCRRLAEPLRLTRAEWQRLEQGLAGLPESAQVEIQQRMQAAAKLLKGPVVCPFLDRDAGACRVYDHRPAACRMYGFYQAHDGGRFCGQIEEKVALEGDEGIVWGNHEAALRRLERAHGSFITLADRLK